MLLDFDRDGTFETDITTYLDTLAGGFTITRGMNIDGAPQISELSFNVNNGDGRFNPDYTSGPYYAYLTHVEGTPMQVQVRDPSSTWRAAWTGYVRSVRCQFGRFNGGIASFRARDIFHYIKEYRDFNLATTTSVLTSTAFTSILTALGMVGADYSVAVGKQTLPYHYARGAVALNALAEVMQSEMGGSMFVKRDGVVRFEGRDARLGVASPDFTWGDGTNRKFESIEPERTDEEVQTSITVIAQIFNLGQADTVLFRSSRSMYTKPTADSMALTAGEVYEAVVEYGAPAYALTAPVAITDYLSNTAANGTGTDKTSALTVTATDLGAACRIKIVNTDASTVYLTWFQLRGQPASFTGPNPQFVATKSNIGDKIVRSRSIRVPFADDTQTLRDYPYQLVRTYRRGYPRVTLSFSWTHDDIITDMTIAEIGDLVRLTDTANGAQQATMLDDWFYIERIKLIVPTPGAKVPKRSEVTLVPSYLWRNLDKITYDLFTRSNGAVGRSTQGTLWTSATNFEVSSNKGVATVTTAIVPILGALTADVVVEVSAAAITTGASAEVGVVYRYTDASNYWRAYVSNLNDKVYLEKVVGGAVTTVSQPAWTVTATAEIRVYAQGNRHRVYVDDVLYIDTTDAALNTQVSVGLYLKGATTTTVDDFYAQGL